MRLLILLILLVSSPTLAANKTCPSGVLTPTAGMSATGATADTVTARAATALAFQSSLTGGTATVQVQMCCLGTCDPATGAWATVTGSDMAITTAASQVISVLSPTCIYRGNVSACSSCAGVQVGFACSGP